MKYSVQKTTAIASRARNAIRKTTLAIPTETSPITSFSTRRQILIYGIVRWNHGRRREPRNINTWTKYQGGDICESQYTLLEYETERRENRGAANCRRLESIGNFRQRSSTNLMQKAKFIGRKMGTRDERFTSIRAPE